MFYTTLGRVTAVLALAVGFVGIAIGIAVATGTLVEPEPGHYLGTKTSGEWVNRGIYQVLFGIVLGVITDISQSVGKDKRVKREKRKKARNARACCSCQLGPRAKLV